MNSPEGPVPGGDPEDEDDDSDCAKAKELQDIFRSRTEALDERD